MTTCHTATTIPQQCGHCRQAPRYERSDDPQYRVLMVHDTRGCPASIAIYHTSRTRAVSVWESRRPRSRLYLRVHPL